MSLLPPALRHRNYRLYFVGQGLSVLGSWIQRVAMSWLVYRLSGSELLLGLSGFASQIPILLLAPIGGVIVDRFDRRRLLVFTQALAMVQAVLIAALALTGWVTVWHVLLLAALLGTVNAVDVPLRQSFVANILDDRRDLPNAIALNSLLANAGRLVGPSIAGLMIAATSEAICFAVNAASYIAVLAAVLMMRIPARPAPPRRPIRQGLADGIAYARGSPPVRALLGIIALVSFMITPYTVLMPVFADRVLQGGAGTMGMMLSSAGLGAVCGTLILAYRKGVEGLARIAAMGAMLAGAALAVFAWSTHVWLSAAMMALTGSGVILTAAPANTLLQSIVPDRLRGRIASFYTVAFLGVSPLGALTLGALAEVTDARIALCCGGVLCLVGAGLFRLRLHRLEAALAKPAAD